MTETQKPIVKLKITKIGIESAVNADARGLKVELSHIKYSADYFESTVMDERTNIPNVIFESSIEVGGTSEDGRTLRLFSTINAPSSMQINSLGVYTTEGVLFAVASVTNGNLFKVFTGISFIASFGMTFSASLLEMITVTTDENTAQSLILMAQHELSSNPHPQYLRIDKIKEHIVIPKVPDASTTVKGIVMLADNLVTDDPNKALTARQGMILARQLSAGVGLGIGQEYIPVTRTNNGTRYYNNTGQPIAVLLSMGVNQGRPTTEIRVNEKYIGNIWMTITGRSIYTTTPITFIVPDGSFYQIFGSAGVNGASELKKP